MSRHKRRNKTGRKPPQSTTKGGSERGFEFGIRRRAPLVSGVEVVSDLFEATVKACGYGWIRHPELGTIPEIFLAAVHPEPLKRALAALKNWDSADGDDGFELEFVFLSEGGYLLGIAPNAAIIQNRLRGSDRLFEPIVTGPLFIKGMDTRHRFLEEFREYCKDVVAPFIYSGARITSQYSAPQEIGGVTRILKFGARFSDENEVAAGSFAEAMLATRRGTVRKLRRKQRESALWQPDRKEPARIPLHREDQLRRHLPASVWRLSGSSAVGGFRSRHSNLPISESQVIQAVVNLILSNAIVGKYHYAGVGRSKLPTVIQLALRERFELADSAETPSFADELVLKQVVLDGKALLEALNLKLKTATLENVLNLLHRRGLA